MNPEYKTEIVDGREQIEIKHREDLFDICSTLTDRASLRKWTLELALTVIPHFAHISDLESYMDKLIRDEKAVDRALSFSELWLVLDKLLGRDKRVTIRHWRKLAEGGDNQVKRIVPWISTFEPDAEVKGPPEKLSADTSPTPATLLDDEGVRHSDITVSSVINVMAWNKASWGGVGYVFHPEFPPVVIIGFKDLAAGKLIFESLRREVGKTDSKDQLSISIVTGISKANVHEYGIMFSPNIDVLKDYGKRIVTVSRVNRMSPADSTNLTNFRAHLSRFGAYFLIPGDLRNLDQLDINAAIETHGIRKTAIDIKEAWQIGDNEMLMSILDENDDPIIPPGVRAPPVESALARIRSMRAKRKKGPTRS